jgi:hypothetical protein
LIDQKLKPPYLLNMVVFLFTLPFSMIFIAHLLSAVELPLNELRFISIFSLISYKLYYFGYVNQMVDGGENEGVLF